MRNWVILIIWLCLSGPPTALGSGPFRLRCRPQPAPLMFPCETYTVAPAFSEAELRGAIAGQLLFEWETRGWIPAGRRGYGTHTSPPPLLFAPGEIDWSAVLRRGARGVVIRGFNATGEEAAQAVRGGARDALIEAFNRQGAAGAHHPIWQELLALGVEDAVIEAFNAARVAKPEPPLPPGWREVSSGWIASEERITPLAHGSFRLEPAGKGMWNVHAGERVLFRRAAYFSYREEIPE